MCKVDKKQILTNHTQIVGGRGSRRNRLALGVAVGVEVGWAVGVAVGVEVGWTVGVAVGVEVGWAVGVAVGVGLRL